MKTVLLARDTSSTRYLADRLLRAGRLDALVLEISFGAKRSKLRRMVRRRGLWGLPLVPLDLWLLWKMGRTFGPHLHRTLVEAEGLGEYPAGLSVTRFDDPNDPDCVEHLRWLAPDVLLVYGTRILLDSVLAVPKKHCLNLHEGVVPKYRGNHCAFWAMAEGDEDGFGSTVLHVRPGVDDGPVALERRTEVTKADTLCTILEKNARLTAELAIEALDRAEAGDLPAKEQGDDDVHCRLTPTFCDYWHARKRIRLG